ncbi:MAG: GNAT family N-acetyltransferase [Bacteroidota bacterium]
MIRYKILISTYGIMHIRPTIQSDLPQLKQVLDSIELFPSEMLDDMIADFFHHSDSPEIWLTAEVDGIPQGIAYCVPEQMTNGTYNLLAIGVKQALQGKGIGQQIMTHLEEFLRNQGQHILIVDTSGTDGFQRTRKF